MKGTLHHVGAVLEPMQIGAFSLIGGEKKISGSPLGSPALNRLMLEFCERHNILWIYIQFSDNTTFSLQNFFSSCMKQESKYKIILNTFSKYFSV